MNLKYKKWQEDGIKYGGSPDLVIPNGYLSNFSIEKLKNEEEWVEHYIKGNKRDLSQVSYIKAGEEFAKKRETEEEYSHKYPSLPIKEHTEIIPVTLIDGITKACLLIKVDCMSEDMMFLQDDKTSDLYKKQPWDRQKVYNNQQFRLYAFGIYEKTGKIPQFRCCVIDMVDNKEIGTFTMYAVQYTREDMEDMRRKFTLAVAKASNLVKLYGSD